MTVISEEEHDEYMAAAQRARRAARGRIREQIPEGVELTDEEKRFLNHVSHDTNGVDLSAILLKVVKAAWALGHKQATKQARGTERTWTLLWEGRPQLDEGIRDNPILGVFDSEEGAKAELAEFVRNDHPGFWTVTNYGANAISADRTQGLYINAFKVQHKED